MGTEVGFAAEAVGSWSMPGEDPAPEVDPIEELLAINEVVKAANEEKSE